MGNEIINDIEKRIITTLFDFLYKKNKISKYEYKNLLNKLN